METDALEVATAFSGWFTSGDAPGQAPPNWKQAMIVLLTLFPEPGTCSPRLRDVVRLIRKL